jgi:hypothetical protein
MLDSCVGRTSVGEEQPFETTEPTAPFSNGPFLLVAVPESVEPLVPVNATSLLVEWEEMLDPLRAAAQAAREFLSGQASNEDWHIGDRFVIPTFASLHRLREFAEDDTVVEVFEHSNGFLHQRRSEVPIALLATEEKLYQSRLPLLLGLAVLATMHEVGLAGRWLSKRYEEDEERIAHVRLAATDRAQRRRAQAEEEKRRERRRERMTEEDRLVEDQWHVDK